MAAGPVAVPAWAKDMSLREAMPISNVPIFQEWRGASAFPATRLLARLDYGNRDPGTVVDRFWLDGPLRISALEEAQFNARLGRMALPASPRAQALVHDITRIDNRDGATLHAKTGGTSSGATPRSGGGAAGFGANRRSRPSRSTWTCRRWAWRRCDSKSAVTFWPD